MTAYDDFRFTSADDLADLGGPASRFNHNITAIKLLKSLEAEGRARGDLTPDEQRTLTRYSGWGDSEAFNRLFPNGAYPEEPIHPELDGILTIEEREKIAASALNAHYTALPIIGAIYEVLDYLGIGALDFLRVLEPAAGIGHFFGAMPAGIAAKAERVAVELDSITARILRYLYPNVKVFNQGFEETALPNGYFDLALGNVPFGNIPIHDPRIKERHLKAAIHDYFFARSPKLVKPGGIIAFITSRYTLDKVDSRVRRHIAEHAELLAAARLPESAFRKNAGTEVVTDVLILRKKVKSGGVDEKTGWLETDVFPNEVDYRVPFNRLYIERPDLMLGVPGCSRGMYSDCEFTLKPDGRHLASALRDSLISQLPYQAITATASQPTMLAPSLMEDAQEKEKANAVNLDRIAALTGQTKDEAAGSLRGLIYETSSGIWVTADEYLSGNVVAKLKEAQAAAALDPRFQENVEALKAVQPTPLGPEEIAARLGAGWIPPEFVRDFIREIIPQFDGQVEYVEHLGVWKIEGSSIWARSSIEATQTWGV